MWLGTAAANRSTLVGGTVQGVRKIALRQLDIEPVVTRGDGTCRVAITASKDRKNVIRRAGLNLGDSRGDG